LYKKLLVLLRKFDVFELDFIKSNPKKSNNICKRKDERQKSKGNNLIRKNREEQTDTPHDVSYTTHYFILPLFGFASMDMQCE